MLTKNPFEGKNEINVVFLGGSITEGYRSSSPEKSYAGICSSWFKSYFSSQTVNCYNAGIGGTGSGFGAVRMDRDVLSHNPDMLFVEFAVNDGNKDSRATMDSIVRKALSAPKVPYIVFLYTTNNIYTTDSSFHEEVAAYYGIPSIDLQSALKEKLDGADPIEKGLFLDSVHPLDGGFEIYAEAIIDRLNDDSTYAKPVNKAPISENTVLFSADFVPSPRYSYSSGFELRKGHRGYEALYTVTPGETVKFEFDGNFLALEGGLHRESALVDVEVVGESIAAIGFYYNMESFQTCFKEVTHSLPMGHHSVTLTVKAETAEAHPGSTLMLYHIITGVANKAN